MIHSYTILDYSKTKVIRLQLDLPEVISKKRFLVTEEILFP